MLLSCMNRAQQRFHFGGQAGAFLCLRRNCLWPHRERRAQTFRKQIRRLVIAFIKFLFRTQKSRSDETLLVPQIENRVCARLVHCMDETSARHSHSSFSIFPDRIRSAAATTSDAANTFASKMKQMNRFIMLFDNRHFSTPRKLTTCRLNRTTGQISNAKSCKIIIIVAVGARVAEVSTYGMVQMQICE